MRVGGSTRLAVVVEGEDVLVLGLYRRSVREGAQINALADGLGNVDVVVNSGEHVVGVVR